MTHYLIVGALLFGLGLVGFLARRNLIIVFLSTELMFQGVVVNFVAFGRLHENLQGQSFALFLLAVAAVEAHLVEQAIGLRGPGGLALPPQGYAGRGRLEGDAGLGFVTRATCAAARSLGE